VIQNTTPKTGQIETDPEKIGRVYGYAGKGSQMCNMWPDTDGRYNKIKGAIGKIVVGYWPKISRGWYEEMEKGDPVCALKKHSYGILEAGVEQYISTIHYYGFYWQNPYTGKIRLCALAPYTMFPVKIGCGTIAPPAETSGVDPFIAAYVSGTRCEYLIRGRDDLNSLGKAAIGGVDQSVNRFLRSDLHMTSTVVGCIKDMLLQIFMKSPSGSTGVAGAKPFFQVVQERMKQIVLAALTLYVTLIGLKIMTAGQPPSRAEAVMYFVKFALVLYFATGDAWYAEESGKVVGLYPSILTISEELSSIFLEAQNVNDPLKMCYLNYRSHNILANNDIITDTIPNGVSTAGYPGFIKTTVWDLIDCKVTNYLSFGSCNYSVGGMMSAWITSGAIFTNFPVAICAFIYTLMIIITVFKFAHVFILSMFTITILVFLSPIFVVFALYEPTKGMFQKWMQMLIGYMLYPALLFAFVAIMFATFDAVFYGDLDITKLGGAQGTGDYKAACTNVDSIFCINVEQVGYNNPCEAAAKRLSDDLLESRKVTGFGKYSKLSDAYTAKIRDALLKLMLFSLLFYLFLSSIIEFMAVLVGVQGFGEAAQGLGTALGPIKMAAKAGGKAALAVASAKTAGLAGKAVKGAQKTKGDVKEWMTGRR
jgi:type IV secretion system protein VirB6